MVFIYTENKQSFKFDYDGSCIWKIVNLGGDYMCYLSVITGIN